MITIQVLRALSAAHQAGILHRDIKPSNILFGWDGQAKVSDFGIATIIEASADDLEATSTMELFGTPSYLAPERALGERPTAMSDIYSVGTVLYEMITGVKPFVAETPMAVIMSAQSGKYVLASELNAQVSSYIDAVISKALNPNPSERFLTANEMIVTLAGQSNDDATRILPTAAFGVTSAIPVLADLDTTERTERIATIESVAKQKKPSWRSKEVLFALIAVLVVAIFVMWSTLGSSSGSKIKSFPTTSTIPAQIIPSTTTSSTTTSSTTTSSTTTTAPTPPGPPGKGGPPGQSKNK